MVLVVVESAIEHLIGYIFYGATQFFSPKNLDESHAQDQ